MLSTQGRRISCLRLEYPVKIGLVKAMALSYMHDKIFDSVGSQIHNTQIRFTRFRKKLISKPFFLLNKPNLCLHRS